MELWLLVMESKGTSYFPGEQERLGEWSDLQASGHQLSFLETHLPSKIDDFLSKVPKVPVTLKTSQGNTTSNVLNLGGTI